MHVPHPSPARVPQRVLVASAPGATLEAFLPALAGALDVPLVPATELATPAEVALLAAFDGWVSTGDHPGARPRLLERAETLVHLAEDAGTLRTLVRRTVRKIRAEAVADLAWVDALALTHPELPVVRLTGQVDIDVWLRSLGS